MWSVCVNGTSRYWDKLLMILLVTGSNVKVLCTIQGRTVTVRELARKLTWVVNAVRRGKRVSVFPPRRMMTVSYLRNGLPFK